MRIVAKYNNTKKKTERKTWFLWLPYSFPFSNCGPSSSSSTKSLQHQVLISWSLPPPPFFKLNTDGSCKKNPGRVGIAGVFRSSFGQWMSVRVLFCRKLPWGTNLFAGFLAITYWHIRWVFSIFNLNLTHKCALKLLQIYSSYFISDSSTFIPREMPQQML